MQYVNDDIALENQMLDCDEPLNLNDIKVIGGSSLHGGQLSFRSSQKQRSMADEELKNENSIVFSGQGSQHSSPSMKRANSEACSSVRRSRSTRRIQRLESASSIHSRDSAQPPASMHPPSSIEKHAYQPADKQQKFAYLEESKEPKEAQSTIKGDHDSFQLLPSHSTAAKLTLLERVDEEADDHEDFGGKGQSCATKKQDDHEADSDDDGANEDLEAHKTHQEGY